MRTVDFAFRVLRNGAFYGWLHAPAAASQTIRMDEGAEIKTSLTGEFVPTVTGADGSVLSPNWLSDEIQPVLIIDGVEHNLGIFAPASVTPTESSGIKTLRIEAYDRCWRVRDKNAEQQVFLMAGTNYVAAIESLLAAAGITSATAIPTSATLTEAREDWEIGTSYLKIINELLDEINYNPLYFDADGVAIIEPASVPTADSIRHSFSDEPDAPGAEPVIRMLPQISRETDVYQTANVFVAWCANPDKSGNMVATAENDTEQSPLSISRRGRRIVKVTRLNNIASQAQLQAYVNRQRDMSMIGGETLNVQTALLPDFGVNDVVSLRWGDLAAVCIDRAWTMDLRVGGVMTHRLERVVYNIEVNG